MSKNPAPLPLQIELLAAAENHPERNTLDRMLASGDWCLRSIAARQCLVDSTEKFIVFRIGALRYRVRNCPARLRQLAEIVSKSHGFNGKKTPKPTLIAHAVLFTHSAYGFKLSIPAHLAYGGSVTIGTHTLTLHMRSRTMTGAVPASWLIDLNGAHPDDAEPTTPTAAPLPRVIYSEFIRSAGKREAPMLA